MAKKIILLSDGTGNSAAKVWRTNVWRVFESLDLSGSDQVAFYDDGVGTASFKPLAILGGAFGLGLGRNVVDLYKFACRNYRNDADEICGFGFSRGAFTIRVVIGLILEQGLVDADKLSESELHAKAKAAYRAYRANNFHTNWPAGLRPEDWLRGLRNLVVRSHYSADDNRETVHVRFLGLWDTVAAYGMPVEEMARGISQWLWPWMLPDCVLHRCVCRACHALSIDDDRTTFHPVLWDESDEHALLPNPQGRRFLSNERISQVWFAGAHANVGGGYPDDSLAQIPLIWIQAEASKCGLRFKSETDANPQTSGHPITAQDKDGRMYHPRAGLGSYYRYGPRDIQVLGETLLSRQGSPFVARIHESVFRRIVNRAHAYAPLGLPANYELVTADGELITPQQSGCEQPAQAYARWQAQQQVWNTIWWRRIFYFIALAVTIYLFAFPVLDDADPVAEHKTHIRWLSDIIRTLGDFLPTAATWWKDGYAREPAKVAIVALLLIAVLQISSWLAAKIHDQMERLWRKSLASALADTGLPTDLIYRLRTHPLAVKIHRFVKKKLAPALFALVFAYLGLTFVSHMAFNVWDNAGLICAETATDIGLKAGDFVSLIKGGTDRITDYPAPSESEKNNLLKYLTGHGASLPTFDVTNPCQNMAINVEHGGDYLIQFESTSSFSHWRGASWLLPLRRELLQPWFRVVARYGSVGGDEDLINADNTDLASPIDTNLHPQRDGQLFLFVNDAVFGVPCLLGRCYYGALYGNNGGKTRVLILRKPLPEWKKPSR
jgi:uncharacterized protein (DUF2235 family)